MNRSIRTVIAVAAASGLCFAGTAAGAAVAAGHSAKAVSTATPIQHLVVIFQENVSFDHYFATYPRAANSDGNPFHAKPGTPSVNGLGLALRTHNPNENQPHRLSSSQALTCDQDHGYTAEQKAYDGGLMDQFVQDTGNSDCTDPEAHPQGLVMDYYDGNTVTGLWNYAQRFAMSDDFFDTEFGPSTPGALNLVSGQTAGATAFNASGDQVTDPGTVGAPNPAGVATIYGDADPFFDECSSTAFPTVAMSGQNIGDLLNAKKVSWGWFEGGFAPTGTAADGTPVCGQAHKNIGGAKVADYIPHHEPFQYSQSTANPFHLPPASLAEVGHNGQANHQYDMSWFFKALAGNNLPSVSFLKAPAYQDGHAGYSDPTDEQHFLVNAINKIQGSKFWKNTAIMVTYDDSDGWYDHVMSPIINPSADPATDALNGTGVCGHGTPLAGAQDRCGYGQRLPFLVIPPYSRQNFVSGQQADQTSILKFIENNWLGDERVGGGSYDSLAGNPNDMFDFHHPNFKPLFLKTATGEPTGS